FGARGLRRLGDYCADRAEHARRHRHPRRAAVIHHGPDGRGVLRSGGRGGEDKHTGACAGRPGGGGACRAPPPAHRPDATHGGGANRVVDAVMVGASGDRLLAGDGVEPLRGALFPRALVVTPNLPEAAALLDGPLARNETEMRQQAERLLAFGCRAVLLKGGHGEGPQSVDLLVEPTRVARFAAERIATENTHGTGCTLASAIAAGRAKRHDLATAVGDAKDYVTAAIAAADRLRIGSGHGPPHPFYRCGCA